jgi:hypothetical protein
MGGTMKPNTKEQAERKSHEVKGKGKKKKTGPLGNKPDLDGRLVIRKSRWEGLRPGRSA